MTPYTTWARRSTFTGSRGGVGGGKSERCWSGEAGGTVRLGGGPSARLRARSVAFRVCLDCSTQGRTVAKQLPPNESLLAQQGVKDLESSKGATYISVLIPSGVFHGPGLHEAPA